MSIRKLLSHSSIVIALAAASSGCAMQSGEDVSSSSAALTAASSADRAALALRWAPIHYQDVDQTGSHALGGKSDYITRYDFDGDLEGRNNWEHTGNSAYPLSAHGYYSVAETSSHWFIVYMFFHPRDWSDSLFDTEHENDAEGVMFTIRRDGSQYGSLQAAVAVAHKDFYSYLPAGSSWSGNAESVDGTLPMYGYEGALHPVTAQEAKGHGLKARGGYDIVGDGVVYYPSLTTAEVPSGPDDRDVKYKLVDMFEPGGVWDQRFNGALFGGYAAFAGNKSDGCGSGTIGCGENSANPPWGWDDQNDGPVRGELATNPAGLAWNYFRVPEGMSGVYTYNPFNAPLSDNQLYDLRPSHATNKCADVEGGSTADGGNVSLYDCHGRGNQLFWAFQQSGGYFVLVNATSGKCLDQAGSGNGANVVQWGCHFGDNQQWRPEQVNGNLFKLVNKQSGRVLEISGNQSTQNGANIQTWDYDGSGDMIWQINRH